MPPRWPGLMKCASVGVARSGALKDRVLRSWDSPRETGLLDKFQFRAVIQDFLAPLRTQTAIFTFIASYWNMFHHNFLISICS